MKNSTVPTEGQRNIRPNMKFRCISDSPLSHLLKIPPVTNHALYYDRERNALKDLFLPAAGKKTQLKNQNKNRKHLSVLRHKD